MSGSRFRQAALLTGLLLPACGNGEGGPQDDWGEAVFPRSFRTEDYVEVRACRSSGEHSGLAAYTVWVSPDAADAFEALFADPPSLTEMPAGSVVVKESYLGFECSPSEVDHWAAMKKEPGFAPEHGDWRWQELDADGRLRVDGADPGCIGCHRGTPDTTCRGYGAENDKDYICTEP